MISGNVFLQRREWVLLAGLMSVVSALTAAERERLIPLSVLAASPHAVVEARLWSLLTSALLVQSPLFWSLASFALLGVLTLKVCGTRVLLISGLAGHVASTLVVYALLALTRTFDPHAFEAVLSAPDYGVSAISAAWLGAIASVSWRARDRTLRGKIATALAVVATALFGWTLRRHLGFLDLEHVVAFGIGVVVAVRLCGTVRATRVELRAVTRRRRFDEGIERDYARRISALCARFFAW